jgi:hypothetical protein
MIRTRRLDGHTDVAVIDTWLVRRKIGTARRGFPQNGCQTAETGKIGTERRDFPQNDWVVLPERAEATGSSPTA